MLQAFALASHACHVHLGTRPGHVADPSPLPRLRSTEEAALPAQNLIPLPQLDVSLSLLVLSLQASSMQEVNTGANVTG